MYHVQIMNISGKAIQQLYKSSRHSYKMVHQQQLSALLVVVVYWMALSQDYKKLAGKKCQ